MNASDIITMLENRQPTILGYEKYRKYAILLPLIEVNKETHILFEVRSKHMRSQPGDICFPGGKVDPDDPDEKHAAIRETSEELRIKEADISGVVPLDYMVSDSGRIVYPFIGRITPLDQISPNRSEVEEIFTVPLNYFIQTKPEKYKVDLQVIPEKDFPYEWIYGGENYNWKMRQIDELFYPYDGKAIWGLTAKVLTHFIELLKQDSFTS